MSLLAMVEQAIKSCKAEQARINDSIQLYRELLHGLTPQPNTGSDESECADAAVTDPDTSPGEKEDMELLERALEKALRVRTGSGTSKKDSNKQTAPQKEPGTTAVASKEGSTAPKGNHSTSRSNCKPASLDRKKPTKPGPPRSSTLGSKSSAAYNPGQCKTSVNRNIIPNSSNGIVHHLAAPGSLDQGHTSILHSKNIRSNVLSGNDLGKAAATSTRSSNNTVPVSHSEESGAHSLSQQTGKASDLTAKWKSLQSKQDRLWDKVVALQRKPVPGRSHFMERMRATFPEDWPCGCPDQTRALVYTLTHQGHDLAQRCQTEELLAKQTPQETATERGGKTRERLPMTTAQLQNFAHQAKREWEAWDRWRPEGGCLCPSGADGMIEPLPQTVTYMTEAELTELEELRMRVTLLRQDIYLEQALSDALSPQLPSVVPGPGRPSLSVLRDVYSLLGEGGERFPAIVLDSEPD